MARFRALCDRAEGGVDGVAATTGLSAENLANLYRSSMKLQGSGNPRGLGPAILRQLDAHYPDWYRDDAPQAAKPTLAQALEVLGEALAPSGLEGVRDEVADNLAQLAKRGGAARYQTLVLDLMGGRYGKRAASG